MDKKARLVMFGALILIGILAVGMAMAGPKKKKCENGIDDDGDGLVDYPEDPGCARAKDNSETSSSLICDNGQDDYDVDTLADFRVSGGDPGCSSATDSSELGTNECDDDSDNDGDGDTDVNDDGCATPAGTDETNCGDGVCEGGETAVSCSADCSTPDSCDDTDGGLYPFTFGTTSGDLNESPYSNDDYCVDSSNVMEYYCSGDYEQSSSENCGTDYYTSNYCNGGDVYRDFIDYSCASGECDSNSTPELVDDCTGDEVCQNGECVMPDSCTDSDGGWDPFVQGTASGYNGGSPYNYTDYCINATFVLENYCIAGVTRAYDPQNCVMNETSGCTSGACV